MPLVIKPDLDGADFIPLDKGSIISRTGHVGTRAGAGKQGISHIQFCRESYTHVILVVIYCLQGVILQRGYV